MNAGIYGIHRYRFSSYSNWNAGGRGTVLKLKRNAPRELHNDIEMSESGTTPQPSISPTGYDILSLDISPGFHICPT